MMAAIRSVRHSIESCSDLSKCINESCQYFRDIKRIIEACRINHEIESISNLLELIHDSLPYMGNAMVNLMGIVLNELISCLSIAQLRKPVERIFTQLTIYQDGAILLKSSLNSVLRKGCDDKESLEFIRIFCQKTLNPKAEDIISHDQETSQNFDASSELYLLDFLFSHEIIEDWMKAESDDKLNKALVSVINNYKSFRHNSMEQFVKALPTIMKMLLANFFNDSISIILSVLDFLEILLIDSPSYFFDHYKDLFTRLQELMGNTRSQTYLPAIHFSYSLAYHLPYTVTCPVLFFRLSNPMDKASLLQVNMQLASLSLLSSRIETVDSIVMRMAVIAAEVLDSSDAFNALCSPGKIREYHNDVSEYFYDSAADLLAVCLHLAHPKHCTASDFATERGDEIILPFSFYYSLNVNIHLTIQNMVCRRAATLVFPSLHWNNHAAKLLSLAVSSAARPTTRKPPSAVNPNTTTTSSTPSANNGFGFDPKLYLPSWASKPQQITDVTSEVKVDTSELSGHGSMLDGSGGSSASPRAPTMELGTAGAIVTRSQRLRAANLRRRSAPPSMPALLETELDVTSPTHSENNTMIVNTSAAQPQGTTSTSNTTPTTATTTTTTATTSDAMDPLWLLKNRVKQPSGRQLRRHSLTTTPPVTLSDSTLVNDFDDVPVPVPPATASHTASLFVPSTYSSKSDQDRDPLSQSFHRGFVKGDRSARAVAAQSGQCQCPDLRSFSEHGQSSSQSQSQRRASAEASPLSNSYHAGMNASGTLSGNNTPFSPLTRGRRSLLLKASSSTSTSTNTASTCSEMTTDSKSHEAKSEKLSSFKNKSTAEGNMSSGVSFGGSSSHGGGGGGGGGGMAFDSPQYPISRDIDPSLHPSQELNRVLLELETSAWPEIFQTLTSVRRLGLHHQSTVRSSASLHAIVKGTLKQTENLRSAVTKNALLAIGDLFEGMGKDMDAEVPNIALVLLKRCADSSVFLSETADHAAFQMIGGVTPSKCLSGLLSGCDHRNSALRSKVAMLLLHLLNSKPADLKCHGGSDLNLLLRKLSKLISDSGAETRAYSREIVNSLITKEIVTRSELVHYVPADVIDRCVRGDVSVHSTTIQTGTTTSTTRSNREVHNANASEATDTLLPHLVTSAEADSDFRKTENESIHQAIKRKIRHFF